MWVILLPAACGLVACHALLGSDVTQTAERLALSVPIHTNTEYLKSCAHTCCLIIKRAAYIFIHTQTHVHMIPPHRYLSDQ